VDKDDFYSRWHVPDPSKGFEEVDWAYWCNQKTKGMKLLVSICQKYIKDAPDVKTKTTAA
jgi:hypothetical protein